MNLASILDGWQGYQTSLLHAVAPLTPEQLAWRPTPAMRSLGELIRHLALGRITWLARMNPPGIQAATARVPQWHDDGEGERHVSEEAVPCSDAAILAEWLVLSWKPIESLLAQWTPEDLLQTYPHRFDGKVYAISRQWTLWRILSHDNHHGGQIALMLAMQGIPAFELRALGGHIIEPALAPPSEAAGA